MTTTRRRPIAKLHQLTVREVVAADDGDHGDGGGLLLRVRGGSATWVYRYTAPSGKRREMGLGIAFRSNPKHAGESLTGARSSAHSARELLRQGVDPIDERDRTRGAERAKAAECKAERDQARLTLARAARDYHERVIEPTRSAKHGAQWLSSLENHVPAAVWHAPIASINAPALLAALQAIRPHERARNVSEDRVPETLRRIRQRLDSVFEDAIFHGNATHNPAAAIKRKLRESMPARQAGQFAALPYRAAPALMARLRRVPGTAARCLEFAVLTAARTSEALLAEWSELDLQACVWVIPATRMKAREEHVVHLAPRAVEILRAQLGQHTTLVFPSPMKPDSPLSNMAMLKTLGRLGARAQTTVHGLCRSTFSTWANETGVARPDVIEACLAHREADRIRAAYNRAEFGNERRELLTRWAGFLASAEAVALRAA